MNTPTQIEFTGKDTVGIDDQTWQWYSDPETRKEISRSAYYGGIAEEEFWDSDHALELVESKGRDAHAGDWEIAYMSFQSENGWMGDLEEIKGVVPPDPYFFDGDDRIIECFSKDYENLAQRYGRPIKARTRWVFFDTENNRVLKLIGTQNGFIDSQKEIMTAKRPGSLMCDTKWVPDMGWGQSGLILESEMVTPLSMDDDRFPEWGMSIDCGQVGVTADGQIKAYDM